MGRHKAKEETPQTGLDKRRRSRFWGDAWKRRLPLLPALLFTIVVTQVPFLFSIYYSLTRWAFNKPREPREFIGFGNYVDMVSDSFFRTAIWNSVFMTTVAVLLSLLFGTLIALLLDRSFFGQGLARTLIITPFLVMPVVASLVWKNQMFNATFGVINWLLTMFGLDAIEFSTRYPISSIIVVLVWQWTPFMMLILLAGLQSQSDSILEAAKVDGASAFSTFRSITLPHLRRYLELGALLGVIYLSQVFDHIEVITGGRSSKNVPYFVYQSSVGGGWRFGEASAYSVVVVIASIVLANFGLRVLSGLLEDDGV